MKRAMTYVTLGAVCALLSCSAALPQDVIPTGGPIPDIRGFNSRVNDPEAVAAIEVIVRHVAGQVYVIAGAGGNMTVMAGDDGIFIVDTNFPVFYDEIMTLIRRISDGPIRFVVNTHSHVDHAGNNENFAREGAVIVTQPNLRRALIGDSKRIGSSGRTACDHIDGTDVVSLQRRGNLLRALVALAHGRRCGRLLQWIRRVVLW